MSLALSKTKSSRDTRFARLQDEWCEYPGSWEDFVHHVLERGEHKEIALIRECPDQFRVVVQAQKNKIQARQATMAIEYIKKLEELTEAVKLMAVNGEVHEAPDNTTRLTAIKTLLSTSLMALSGADEKKPDRQQVEATVVDPEIEVSEEEIANILEVSKLSERRAKRGHVFREGCEGRTEPVIEEDEYRGTG